MNWRTEEQRLMTGRVVEAVNLGDLAEWAHGHSMRINSAHEVWMGREKTLELRRLVGLGWRVRARAFDPAGDFPGKLGKVVAQMARHGWRLFDQEDNVDSGEAIFVKPR